MTEHSAVEMMIDIALAAADPTPPRTDLSVSPGTGTFDAYSNYNHVLQDGPVAERLQAAEVGTHAAWNFNGRIWFKDGLYHEEVWRYRSPVEVLTNADLAALIASVNEKYGTE